MTAFRKDHNNTRKYDNDSNSHLVSEDKTRDCGETGPSASQSSHHAFEGHYQNIIPIKVNSEPVYIEVETGSLRATNNRKEALGKALQRSDVYINIKSTNIDVGKPSTTKQSLYTESHQSDRIYAEIHHDNTQQYGTSRMNKNE